MRNKKTRLAIIVDIIENNRISNQAELLMQLAARGVRITQATLSRDLRKLHTTKVVNDAGGYHYVLESALTSVSETDENAVNGQPQQPTLHPAALSVRRSGNILVIKTRTGYACGLAYDIDALKSPLILGTIPGADTVFAVLVDKASTDALIDLLNEILPPAVIRDFIESRPKPRS